MSTPIWVAVHEKALSFQCPECKEPPGAECLIDPGLGRVHAQRSVPLVHLYQLGFRDGSRRAQRPEVEDVYELDPRRRRYR